MDDIYENVGYHNLHKERKLLSVFDYMTFDMLSKKKKTKKLSHLFFIRIQI